MFTTTMLRRVNLQRHGTLAGLIAAIVVTGAFTLLLWLVSSFLATMMWLTIAYLAAAILFTTLGLWTYGMLRGGEQQVGFREAIRRAVNVLVSTNNRRWACLVGMTFFTFIIACEHPGSPVLPGAVRNLPKDLLSDSVWQNAWSAWEYLVYGNNPPANKPTVPAEVVSWFWWEAFWAYLLATIIYSFFAFSDEVALFFHHIGDLIRERQEAHRAQAAAAAQAAAQGGRQRRGGQAPAPAPAQQHFGWVQFITGDLIVEAIMSYFGRRRGQN
jgi:hypothetical protein